MKKDSRLSGVLHLVLHLSHHGGPLTSEQLAKAMHTHPVVVRRVLAGLRERGYVHAEKGHGGGWTLACDPAHVTLRDVYEALGSPPLLALGHRPESPGCLVDEAVHAALRPSFRAAEELLLARLANVSLADLLASVRQRMTEHSGAACGANAASQSVP